MPDKCPYCDANCTHNHVTSSSLEIKGFACGTVTRKGRCDTRRNACYATENAELKVQLAQAKAVIDEYPKTGDGVPIVPGMKVWHAYWAGPREEEVAGFEVCMVPPTIWMSDTADEGRLYSTQEAAAAAIAAAKNKAAPAKNLTKP